MKLENKKLSCSVCLFLLFDREDVLYKLLELGLLIRFMITLGCNMIVAL